MNRISFCLMAALAALSISAPLAALAKETGSIDPALFSAMRWRDVGPSRGGRTLAVAGVSGEPGLFYFGAAAGGVWKTEDNGGHWKPIFDQVPYNSIGAIGVAPSDHKVIYVGTGEGALRNDITYGRGVYKSVDGGESWTHIGLSDTRQIGALIVDPRNPDIVMVAAIGHVYGPNAKRGVFRSEDGGKSWKKVLYRDENTGAADITYDPHNPDIVFASLWQIRVHPWGEFNSSRGPGSGLFRSKDGGKTWTELKGNGLPDNGSLGRIGVSVSGADSKRVYAVTEAGLYRSEDGGERWTRINDDVRLKDRPEYYSKIYADPKSIDTVYIMAKKIMRSTDGGKTIDPMPTHERDSHALWIDPADTRRMVQGSDLGAGVSLDGGETWSTADNQPLAQFYRVAVDNGFPYRIYGSHQDYDSVAIASADSDGEIGPRSWFPAGGGEWGYVVPDPRDPMIIYSSTREVIARYDKRKDQWQDIRPWLILDPGVPIAGLEHRFSLNTPLMLSPHDPDLLYAASQVVWKSADHGNSWTIISPDLTRNDKSKQQHLAGRGGYNTISALAESPVRKGMLWAGSDDGLVHLTRDGGGHWTDVTPKAVPKWGWVSKIEPSPFKPETAYVAVDRHRHDDIKPYVLKTHDAGKSWTLITNGLPEGAFVRVVREDPKRPGLLYAGTERGVFVSFDDGGHWQPLQLNLPSTPIYDLVVKGDDLVVATHGRGFWVLDNLTPLRQITPDTASREVVLLTPGTAYRWAFLRGGSSGTGQNPPAGAIIDYILSSKPQSEITLDILDAKGALVRHLSSTTSFTAEPRSHYSRLKHLTDKIPTDAGMNRFVWDLRTNDPEQISPYQYGGLAHGVLVPPGRYTVRLSVDGKPYEQPLILAADPRASGDLAGITAYFELQTAVLSDIDRLHKAMNELRKLRDSGGKGIERIANRLAMLEKEMNTIEPMLVNYSTDLSSGGIGTARQLADYTPPTQQGQAAIEEVHRRVEKALADWSSLRSGRME